MFSVACNVFRQLAQPFVDVYQSFSKRLIMFYRVQPQRQILHSIIRNHIVRFDEDLLDAAESNGLLGARPRRLPLVDEGLQLSVRLADRMHDGVRESAAVHNAGEFLERREHGVSVLVYEADGSKRIDQDGQGGSNGRQRGRDVGMRRRYE